MVGTQRIFTNTKGSNKKNPENNGWNLKISLGKGETSSNHQVAGVYT